MTLCPRLTSSRQSFPPGIFMRSTFKSVDSIIDYQFREGSLFLVLCLAAADADSGFFDDPKMVLERLSVKERSYVPNDLDNMWFCLARHSEHDNSRAFSCGG